MAIPVGHRNVVPLKTGHRNGLSVLTNRHGIPFYSPEEMGGAIQPFDHKLIFNQITQIIFALSGTLAGGTKRTVRISGSILVQFTNFGLARGNGIYIPEYSRMLKAETNFHFYQIFKGLAHKRLVAEAMITFNLPARLAYLMKQDTRRGDVLVQFDVPETFLGGWGRLTAIGGIVFDLLSRLTYQGYIFSEVIELKFMTGGGLNLIDIRLGLLYNHFALAPIRKITSSDDWDIPLQIDFENLMYFLDPEGAWWNNIAAGRMKEKSTVYWEGSYGQIGDTYFRARGSGYRNSTGTFGSISYMAVYWCKDRQTSLVAMYVYMYNRKYVAPDWVVDNSLYYGGDSRKVGAATRLIKRNTDLQEGEFGEYVGNDGKRYMTICIGGIEWLMRNLAETYWRAYYATEFGFLYNGYAVIDVRGLAPTGWHVITYTEAYKIWTDYLGSNQAITPYLMEVGQEHWMRSVGSKYGCQLLWGSGARGGSTDWGLYTAFVGWTSTWYNINDQNLRLWGVILSDSGASYLPSSGYTGDFIYGVGYSVRCVKDDANDPGTVTDIDGNVYPTQTVAGMVIMSRNLRTTKYRNGDSILHHEDMTDFTNAASGAYCAYHVAGGAIPEVTGNTTWAAQTEYNGGAMCAYNNDWNNVLND